MLVADYGRFGTMMNHISLLRFCLDLNPARPLLFSLSHHAGIISLCLNQSTQTVPFYFSQFPEA